MIKTDNNLNMVNGMPSSIPSIVKGFTDHSLKTNKRHLKCLLGFHYVIPLLEYILKGIHPRVNLLIQCHQKYAKHCSVKEQKA